MAGKFEVYKDKAGEHRFRLKAGNGEIILTSEGYKNKSSATKGIESVRANAQNPDRFVETAASRGRYRFNLRAGNHHIIGTSQLYESKAGLKNGINSVVNSSTDAIVVDTDTGTGTGTGSTGPKIGR